MHCPLEGESLRWTAFSVCGWCGASAGVSGNCVNCFVWRAFLLHKFANASLDLWHVLRYCSVCRKQNITIGGTNHAQKKRNRPGSSWHLGGDRRQRSRSTGSSGPYGQPQQSKVLSGRPEDQPNRL